MERFVEKIIITSLNGLEDVEFPFNERFGLKVINDNFEKKTEYEFLLKLSKDNKNMI